VGVMSATAPRLTGATPATFRPHALHDPGRTYPETNCYADVLIDLLHACGLEPLAAWAHLVRLDFEGDQWTFFKPPPEDLEALFGVDIHEMQPYRGLPAQIAVQLERGRSVIVELDSWHLPDTATTSYHREHVKTSVAAHAIDPDAQTFAYFHSIGLHELSGKDFRGVFRIGEFSADVLPPYTELVRFDAGPRLAGAELREASRATLVRHLRARPAENPFRGFGRALADDLPALLAADLPAYHDYAFATVRMAGAGFEILGDYAAWLLGGDDGAPIHAACGEIVEGCKALSFRLARRRAFDPGPAVDRMAEAWERAMVDLERAVS
jgi:uncharacterized protein DUF1839